jgi:hypothetical protein
MLKITGYLAPRAGFELMRVQQKDRPKAVSLELGVAGS